MKKILKYFLISITTIIVLIFIQNLILRIPNKLIENNIKESTTYLLEKEDRPSLISTNKFMNEITKLDNFTDSITLNLIWNNTHKTQIEMNYYYDGQSGINSLNSTINNNKKANLEYSRYYQGHIVYVKPLLMLFNLKSIRIINSVIIIILSFYLLYILYKKNKLLPLALILGLSMINIFIVPMTIQFSITFIISLIISIITIKTIDKDDSVFYSLMIISGTTTCFFDFLTTETITLTLPLLLRIYLKNYNKKKIKLKENILFIIKSCFAWGIPYVITFMFKWLLSVNVYGLKEAIKIWDYAKVRIYDIPTNNIFMFIISTLLSAFSFLLPYSIFKSSPVLVIISLLLITWLFIFELSKKNQKLYSLLLIISLIPIIRFIVLYAHTAVHLYFVYRALFPFTITIILIVMSCIIKYFKK